MTNLSEFDMFAKNPIRGIRNTGFYRQRVGWLWENNGDYASVYTVTEGKIEVTVGGERYIAEKGDVIFLRSKDRGATFHAASCDTAYYFISFYYDEEVSLGLDHVTKNAAVTELFKSTNKAFHSEAYLYRVRVAELFLHLLYKLAGLAMSKTKSYRDMEKLFAATEYVNVNYYKKISVEELCAISNYSPAHLRRLFVKHYGMSPQEYVINKKLDAAINMLGDAPDKTVDEIAELLSFCSSSYLCKLFKRREGISILDYKRTVLEKT